MNKLLLTILLYLPLMHSALGLDLEQSFVDEYIQNFQLIAVEEMERSGIPASIKLAQGILESNYGRSELAKKAKNHFGIKCGSKWKGKTYYLWDDDPRKSCFRVFRSAEESYREHTNFLTDPNKSYRYGFLFSYSSKNYKKWAKGLRKAGYATSRTYAKDLIAVIERLELHKYDRLTSNVLASSSKNPKKPKRPNQPKRPQTKKPTTQNAVNFKYGIPVVYFEAGDTPSKIAKRNNLSLKRLRHYNDLRGGNRLKEGQFVYLRFKRNKHKGKKKYHKVVEGDRMHSISQYYGVKLKCLYKMNRLKVGQQPGVGQVIYLRKKRSKAPRLYTKPKPTPKVPVTKTPNENFKPHISKKDPPVETMSTDLPTPGGTKVYIVKEGDTLYSISKKTNSTVEHLKKLNNLKDNTIFEGQNLHY